MTDKPLYPVQLFLPLQAQITSTLTNAERQLIMNALAQLFLSAAKSKQLGGQSNE